MKLDSVSFSYVKGEDVIKGLELEIEEGEIYSLLGRSGSGKSTILSIIAGFLRPEVGRVLLDGKDITDLPPEKRGVGMVFQDLALFPHMTVLSNVMYGINRPGLLGKKAVHKAEELIDIVGLEELKDRLPHQLSGGERQRVALARTLAPGPRVVLFDEPLSAMDPSLRSELRMELRGLMKKLGTTALYVTHDRSEAISISDRIGLLHEGRVIEEGVPEQIYWRPRNLVTARFMGLNNIVNVKGTAEGCLTTDLGRVPWRGSAPKKFGFRPESVMLDDGSCEGLALEGSVRSIEYHGRDHVVQLVTKAGVFQVMMDGRLVVGIGDRVRMVVPFDRLCPLGR